MRLTLIVSFLFLALFSRSILACDGLSVQKVGEHSKELFAPLWEGCDSCSSPESVYYDPQTRFIFVSNIFGEGDKKDGVGVIQKLSSNGKMLNAKWVTGLNAPKGLRAHGGILWVSDIDEVLAIDIEKGVIKSKIKVEGSKFLNDVAVAADGTVYVSDTLGGKIVQVRAGQVSTLVSGNEWESPNGLLVRDGALIVASWGIGVTKDWSTKVPGGLYSIDLKTKKKTRITKKPVGNLDGLEIDNNGDYLVSDWVAGKVMKIDRKGNVHTLLFGFKGSADIAFIPEKQTLIVPRMGENLISAYDLSQYPAH